MTGPITRECPTCHAPAGTPCHNRLTLLYMDWPIVRWHRERIEEEKRVEAK